MVDPCHQLAQVHRMCTEIEPESKLCTLGDMYHWWVVASGGGYTHVKAQFCCEHKTALKRLKSKLCPCEAVRNLVELRKEKNCCSSFLKQAKNQGEAFNHFL